MDAPVAVVPVNGDSNVSCAYPIGCDALVLFDGLFYVKRMLFAEIFNAEIINHYSELFGPPIMLPQSWHKLALTVAVFVESPLE